MLILVAYDSRRVVEIVRDWTPQRLLDELHGGEVFACLRPADAADLAGLAHAWVKRALGSMTLRDALMIDSQRGSRAYDLICAAQTAWSFPLPDTAAQRLAPGVELTAAQVREALRELSIAYGAGRAAAGAELALSAPLATLAARLDEAEQAGLALAAYRGSVPRYPPLANLEELLPPPPAPLPPPRLVFEQPGGWRRTIAMALAVVGALLLLMPLLAGAWPTQPAGLPLALLTLALLVGIRAGWSGYLGSGCIWLVANLPSFHHDQGISLWPATPLLLMGVALLAMDRYVRAMWRWITGRDKS